MPGNQGVSVLEVRVCGGVEVEADRRLLPDALFGGRQGRIAFAFLVCERHRVVRREELADLLWPEQLPESWSASLSAVVSRLRRLLTEAGLDGPTALVSAAGSYQLVLPGDAVVDIEELVAAVDEAEAAAESSDVERAVRAASAAERVAARGFLTDDCDWVDQWRAKVHDLRVRAALARSAAYLAAGSSGRAVAAARDALALDPSREAAFRQVMRALAAAGERGEALRVWERCRITLVEELGVDPAPETEAVYLQILGASPAATPAAQALPSGVVTFLLTDIVESSAMWEEHATAMAVALERHDTIVGEVVAAHSGTLLKSKLEGDATVSVFACVTECANAALALLGALGAEPWPPGKEPRVRMAMHTGEAFERGGDYFGPALNRAARLRSLAGAGEVLLSQAVAELVRDQLPAGVELRDRGHRDLRGLSRGENVFQLADIRDPVAAAAPTDAPEELAWPPVPAALAGAGPFVGRSDELAQLTDLWDRAVGGTLGTAFIGGEPGVGKSRLAGEVATRAHAVGALVLYGRCDEDLSAPLQPFIEAVRTLVPALGAARLRTVRGIDELRRFVPELGEVLAESAPEVRADPDTERLALFDALTQLLRAASVEAPLLLVLDDLHWAGKTTLSLLRHLLREAKGARLLVVGTYRDTELARTHPLAATLADVRRDADTHRIALSGLAAADVDAYLAAIGNTDRALGRELAEVTSGNPFFLIEVLRHVADAGGAWEPGTLPEGVREATGRRLSRLSDAANDALAVAAVVGTTFDLALVEQVRGADLIDPIAEACRAGLVVEEPGALARFRFAHALVRQVLLAELVTLKRVRLHRTIAELLEAAPPAGDPDVWLADLAYHWFECASTGSANKAVEACRRAADRAMERLAYEEAGDLYAMALQALDAVDDVDPEEHAALHLARCDALLTAGDVGAARGAIDALELAAQGSERLAAWYTTYEGLLAVLAEPDRLTEIVQSIGAAAGAMRAVGDLRGEAKAHYVYASALERLGQIGAAERALDAALAAARGAGDPRLANTILAEAPPAALWGPSPVTRASGRCLDVVRVLRITAGAPAVESVALRCQAVLEALRGRVDAARRMIASARRTVEQLGLTHRRLETEVAAGFIELLDGQAGAAETHLRDVYDELRDRGLGGEAAQAGAFLGRALLLQGRVDEADEVAAEAERLAGADLKAGIAWRDVRAEAAARRGNTTRALALAREAVELASATDALLLVADARLTLATVLRAAGDTDAADAEAQRAVDACEAKGATLLAARARSAMSVQPNARRITVDNGRTPTHESTIRSNAAMAAAIQFQEAFNRGDLDAVRAAESPGWSLDDRRQFVAMTVTDDEQRTENVLYAGGGRFDRPELLATRGNRLALCRWMVRAPGFEWPYLAIVSVDADGRRDKYVMFEPDSLDEAMAALEQMATETALEQREVFENDASRAVARVHAAHLARDWHALEACYAGDWTQDDRRSVVSMPLDHEQSMTGIRMIFDGGGNLARETVATRGRSLSVARSTLRLPDHDAIASVLVVTRSDEAGRQELSILYDPDDLDGAMAELDRLFLESEGGAHADVLGHVTSLVGALGRRDTEAIAALIDPEFVVRDHRLVGMPRQSAPEWLASLEDVFALLNGVGRMRVEHILRLSEHGSVFSHMYEGEQDGVRFDARSLMVLRVRDDHPMSLDVYDEHDVAAACSALDARSHSSAATVAEHFANAAWRAGLRVKQALDDRSWPAFLAVLAPGFEIEDNTRFVQMGATGDTALEGYRLHFSLDEFELETSLLATRGDRLALVEDGVWFVDGAAGESEVRILQVVECDANGLVLAFIRFDVDDLERAYDALDGRYVELGGPDLRPYRHAFDSRDWDRYASFFETDAAIEDRRRTGDGRVDRHWLLAYQGQILELAPDVTLRIDHVEAATPSTSLIVDRFVGTRDGGPFEMPSVSLAQIGLTGRITAITLYDIDDLDTARAEYARLTAPSFDDHFPNLAARASRRTEAAANARDWDAFGAALAPAVEYHDRRTGLAVEFVGDDARASWRAMFDVDELRLDNQVIATRGDRLALIRAVAVLRDGAVGTAESAGLGVVETNEECITRYVAFDPDDMTAALDELDARFAALGGSPFMATMRHSFDARDWDTFATLLAEDCTIADYRTAGWGSVSREVFVDYQRSVADLADDVHLWVDHARERGNVMISTGRAFGTNAGGVWEIAFVTVGMVDASGRTGHFESYELSDMAVAIARFHELVAEDEAEPSANTAWRAVRAQVRAVNEQSWEAYTATLAPDFEQDDRRSVVGRVDRGPDAFALARHMFTLEEMRLETTLLETRGDRLVLVRTRATFRDGLTGSAEVVCLNVHQANEGHLMTNTLLFDEDDVQGAQDELDARYRAVGGSKPQPNLAWRAAEHQARSVNTHNWEAYLATLAPDSEIEDRRSGIAIVARGDEAVYGVHHVAFTLDRCRIESQLIATRGDRLALERTTVTFEDGAAGPAEVTCIRLHQVDEHGRETTLLTFDVDDLSSAHAELDARYDKLIVARQQPRSNLAWESMERAMRAFDGRDWDTFSAGFRPDAILDDRRRGFSVYLTGADAISSARVMFDMAEVTWRCALVASAGDRVALVQYDILGTDGVVGAIEVKTLTVVEADGSGRIVRQVSFDDDERDRAEAEMHALHLALSGPKGNRAWESLEREMRAFERHDWDGLAAVLHPDTISDDRRRGLATFLTGDDAIAVMRVMFDMASATWRCRLLATAGDRVALVEYNIWGSDGAVGEIEVKTLTVVEVDDDGRVLRTITFDVDERDRAEAEMRALGP